MKKKDLVRYTQPFSILREGIAIGGTSVALSLAIGLYFGLAYMLPFATFGIWAIYFFRDPERIIAKDDSLFVSPADGIVSQICQAAPTDIEGDFSKMHRISIFMNIFDVHVNRMPTKGTITAIKHIPGRFINASLDKASTLNERCIYICETDKKAPFVVTQIAGFLARRIVPFLEKGASFKKGQRFGLIRFGSRVDLYLPLEFDILIMEGQRTLAGETILAQAKK